MMCKREDLSARVQKVSYIVEHGEAKTVVNQVRSTVMRVSLDIKRSHHKGSSTATRKSLPLIRSTQTKPFPADKEGYKGLTRGESHGDTKETYMSILRVTKLRFSMVEGGHGRAFTLLTKKSDQCEQRSKSQQRQIITHRNNRKLISKRKSTGRAMEKRKLLKKLNGRIWKEDSSIKKACECFSTCVFLGFCCLLGLGQILYG